MSGDAAIGIDIRPLETMSEFAACVELQRGVWGYAEIDLVPARLFRVAVHVGGQVLGAWRGAELVGCSLAYPGRRNGHAYLHSHFVGVVEAERNSGVGRALKLRQRELALAAGIELMEWTFDPLEIKNAYFNIERLGAIVRQYLPNFYGASSSALQAGLPTDRLVAEWWLRSERVTRRLAGDAGDAAVVEASVAVPRIIADWKAAGDERAALLQARNRQAFQQAFAAGLAVVGLERPEEAPAAEAHYRLGRWREHWDYGPAPLAREARGED